MQGGRFVRGGATRQRVHAHRSQPSRCAAEVPSQRARGQAGRAPALGCRQPLPRGAGGLPPPLANAGAPAGGGDADNGITDAGATALGNALPLNRALRVLNLSGNPGIGADGAQALAHGLELSSSLEELNLGGAPASEEPPQRRRGQYAMIDCCKIDL